MSSGRTEHTRTEYIAAGVVGQQWRHEEVVAVRQVCKVIRAPKSKHTIVYPQMMRSGIDLRRIKYLVDITNSEKIACNGVSYRSIDVGEVPVASNLCARDEYTTHKRNY